MTKHYHFITQNQTSVIYCVLSKQTAGLPLVHGVRLTSNIKPALGQRLSFAGG